VFEKISADKLSLFDRRYERDRTAPITFMYRPRHMQFPSVGSLLLFQLQEQTIYGHTNRTDLYGMLKVAGLWVRHAQ